jgi:hypothetical protein
MEKKDIEEDANLDIMRRERNREREGQTEQQRNRTTEQQRWRCSRARDNHFGVRK